ncbi:hypothetical protein LVO79_12760 [Roseivivax marinus]|uniref:hypothetical protein n=1 Tax=Roseivivax marinus TaxID=1379903 RepID=UPI001F03933F|nr:hypothetical protein [Roseivivax marinus]UMA63895.1 hypothetical protein LVO79_12760 [Roseivivax marinus]
MTRNAPLSLAIVATAALAQCAPVATQPTGLDRQERAILEYAPDADLSRLETTERLMLMTIIKSGDSYFDKRSKVRSLVRLYTD